MEAEGHFDPDHFWSTIPSWLKTSRDFYKNLKFMVFKVKERGQKDYEIYRKRQIAMAVQQRLENIGVDSTTALTGHFQGALSTKKFTEVYGKNWPYDYFSLIEAIKIDIEIEVE